MAQNVNMCEKYFSCFVTEYYVLISAKVATMHPKGNRGSFDGYHTLELVTEIRLQIDR